MWIIFGTGFFLIGLIFLASAIFGKMSPEVRATIINDPDKVQFWIRIGLFFFSFIPFGLAAWCFGF